MNLTILICTHNRSRLLEQTLDSLNRAVRPGDCRIEILVVANACTDDTVDFLHQYRQNTSAKNLLPIGWLEEKTPGKSHALNRAIPLLTGDVVAMVDDDHRVDPGFFTNICNAIKTYPQATMYCGRILPDWNGKEPGWVHDQGPYRIYPLPVPRYDYGDQPQPVIAGGQLPLPGGGNLFLKREVFERIGGFSTELGPHGHDLGGGEDSDFVLRALTAGEKLRYVPDVVQHHYVDLERFSLRYILQKSYQRSRSVARVHSQGRSIPRYMWRKLAEYAGGATLSLSWARTRFYLVRLAATLGEMRGMAAKPFSDATGQTPAASGQVAPGIAPVALAFGMATASAIVSSPPQALSQGALSATGAATLFTSALLLKSIIGFSRTGPALKEEIQKHYSRYSLFAFGRLAAWALLISGLMAVAGVAVYSSLGRAAAIEFTITGAVIAAFCGIGAVTALQFCRHLLYLPATIAASSHYRLSRLYPLWRRLSPARLQIAHWTLVLLAALAVVADLAGMVGQGQWARLAMWAMLASAAAVIVRTLSPGDESPPVSDAAVTDPARPNIVMIGSDTLRADRVGNGQYHRDLTPHLNALARRGTHFTHCYVPCARTAPSLISLLTGTWPHTHGIRDNFAGDDQLDLPVAVLPALLTQAGYTTAAIGDWAAADMGKFNLGFEQRDLPEDQWNIKFLIRQGPKDLRLFLSLFTHNGFGKRFLPEMYYLGGIPLTREIGRDARAMIGRLVAACRPFFLNIFMATTHPPFGSEYPYYTLYSEPHYDGESKFVMARLTDPFEIIRRQGDSKKEFDLDQIIDLYDGCVKSFDDEVARIVEHIEKLGIADNTIIVIYSDHGMEFFEHDTWGQGNSVRGDQSARVPLIIVDPRKPPGGVVSNITRTVDIAPTLLNLLGMAQPQRMDGVSLAPYMENREANLDLAACNETGIWLTTLPGTPPDHLRYPDLPELLEIPDKGSGTLAIKREYRDIIVKAKDRMICSGRWKLTYQPTHNGGIYTLFDLVDDPECRSDASHLYPDVMVELRHKLRAWMAPDLAVATQGEDKSGTKGLPESLS